MKRKSAQLTRHICFFTTVFGSAVVNGRRLSRYRVCIRCGAKKP